MFIFGQSAVRNSEPMYNKKRFNYETAAYYGNKNNGMHVAGRVIKGRPLSAISSNTKNKVTFASMEIKPENNGPVVYIETVNKCV